MASEAAHDDEQGVMDRAAFLLQGFFLYRQRHRRRAADGASSPQPRRRSDREREDQALAYAGDRCYVCLRPLQRGCGEELNGTCYACIHSGKLERDPITREIYDRCHGCGMVLTDRNAGKHDAKLCKLAYREASELALFSLMLSYFYF